MASLVSGNVAVRYDEASGVVGTGGVVLAATSRLATTDQATSATMDTSDSSMDTTNGGGSSAGAGVGGTIASVVAGAASLTLVKAETPEHLAGTSTAAPAATPTPPSVPGSVVAATTGGALFPGIAAASKSARSDDWLANANSPVGSPSAALQPQHVVYGNPQQQQLAAESQQQQPPLAHSSPLAHQQQQPNSNNGYASPMSTSSYDPYSPNSKIGECEHSTIAFLLPSPRTFQNGFEKKSRIHVYRCAACHECLRGAPRRYDGEGVR